MGPHNVIGAGEAIATLTVIVIAFTMVLWMAYETRWRAH